MDRCPDSPYNEWFTSTGRASSEGGRGQRDGEGPSCGSGSRLISFTISGSSANTWRRWRATGSSRSSCSQRGATSTTTIRPPWTRLRAGCARPGCGCTACTRPSPTRCAATRGDTTYSTAAQDGARRQAAVREAEAALKIAARIPFDVLVVHLGVPAGKGGAADNSRAAALRSAEEIAALAESAGVRVAFEVIPNDLSSAAARGRHDREGARRAPRRHLHGLRPRAPHGRCRRCHRDGRRAPDHDPRPRQPWPRRRSPGPVSGLDPLGRRAAVDAEDRLRGHVPDGDRRHRLYRRPCSRRRAAHDSASSAR
jgi:hypothetical protein